MLGEGEEGVAELGGLARLGGTEDGRAGDGVRGAEDVFAVGEEGHVSMRKTDERLRAATVRSVLGISPMAGEELARVM